MTQKLRRKIVAGAIGIFLVTAGGFFQDASAVSQFARKYDMSCQTCHTAFPRLNYFGDQFQRNGYQMPGTEEGDEVKKKVGDNNLFIDELGHFFGIRFSVTPIKLETNRLTTNGSNVTRFSFGNPNWVQLFTAGNIFKNTSIIVETEIDSTTAHINWATLGFHNLLKTPLLNIRVGKLSALQNFAQSGRLRMIPSLSIEGTDNLKTGGAYAGAAATHDDETNLSSPQPAVEIFGYKGPFLYAVGVTNGKNTVDTNKYKNFFGTLRGELTDGDFAGSSISSFGYLGWDTANNATARQTDKFWRLGGGANLRWKDLDVIASYIYGKDGNWDLATGLDQKTNVITGQVGYLLSERWFTALQYDWVSGTDKSDNFHKVSPVLTFMPRQNMRIDMGGRLDFRNTAAIGRRHEAFVNIRTMF